MCRTRVSRSNASAARAGRAGRPSFDVADRAVDRGRCSTRCPGRQSTGRAGGAKQDEPPIAALEFLVWNVRGSVYAAQFDVYVVRPGPAVEDIGHLDLPRAEA